MKKGSAQQEKRSQLEEVIEKFNEHYAGEITDGDRILAGILMDKMSKDDVLRKSAQQDGEQIFVNSVFSKAYDKTAMDSYKESREVFGALFSDPKSTLHLRTHWQKSCTASSVKGQGNNAVRIKTSGYLRMRYRNMG